MPWVAPYRTITYPQLHTQTESGSDGTLSTKEEHVFAILRTKPGENPFDLGNYFKNLQQVFGYTLYDWFLPVGQSPCADHRSHESEYAYGPVAARLRREIGLGDSNSGQQEG